MHHISTSLSFTCIWSKWTCAVWMAWLYYIILYNIPYYTIYWIECLKSCDLVLHNISCIETCFIKPLIGTLDMIPAAEFKMQTHHNTPFLCCPRQPDPQEVSFQTRWSHAYKKTGHFSSWLQVNTPGHGFDKGRKEYAHSGTQKHTHWEEMEQSLPTQSVELEQSPDEVSFWRADRVRVGRDLSSI